jgi:restriction enzyme bgcI alpha subunit
MLAWKLETDVNDWVKLKLNEVGLKKLQDFNEESGMSDYLKEALKGAAKTK